MTKKLLLAAACVLLLMFMLFGRKHPLGTSASVVVKPLTSVHSERWRRRTAQPTATQPAEQIVQEKVARSRRDLAEKSGKQNGVSMTPEIEGFFSAVESGDWERIEKTFAVIDGGDWSAGYAKERAPEVTKMWSAIIDAFGVAEQAHLMPPQTLLDYGCRREAVETAADLNGSNPLG